MTYTTEEKLCIFLGERGLAATKFYSLLSRFEDGVDFVRNFQTEGCSAEILGDTLFRECSAWQICADKIVAKMEEQGVVAVTCFSEKFPASLREIPDPPFVLFCRGNTDLLSTRCLAVVGTRKVSVYGKKVTRDFTAILQQHFTIVSGLAYGVDGIAHETTLSEGGKTVAVLGGGVIDVYPAAHQNLAERILQSGGLLVSEYGYDAVPLPYRFPHRNRLVSGLSCGVLVCQASLKSGTASTVECALDQGRDVFTVPGEIYDSGFAGNNRLIKSMQGVCVTTPRDIVEYYRLDEVQRAAGQSYQLNFEEQRVVEALSTGQLTFDELVEKTQFNVADLNFLLANLEIKSIIARLPGNCYRLYSSQE